VKEDGEGYSLDTILDVIDRNERRSTEISLNA
jgi:hypothetical protein